MADNFFILGTRDIPMYIYCSLNLCADMTFLSTNDCIGKRVHAPVPGSWGSAGLPLLVRYPLPIANLSNVLIAKQTASTNKILHIEVYSVHTNNAKLITKGFISKYFQQPIYFWIFVSNVRDWLLTVSFSNMICFCQKD